MSLRHQYLINTADDALANSKKSKPFRVLEIGCGDAIRGRQIADRAVKFGHKTIEYFGFDLFESVCSEHIYSEALAPFRIIELETVKSLIAKNSKVSVIKLFKGDSKVTLPANIKDLPKMNVIFVNGGHSLPTIQSDIEYALKLAGEKTEVVIDNYYPGDYTKGCAFAVDNDLSKRPELTVQVMPQEDVQTELKLAVKLVIVRNAAKADNTQPTVDTTPEYVPVEVVAAPEIKQDVEPAPEVSNSVCDTDVQPARLCVESCPLSSCEHAQQSCDGSRRCESRVEAVHLELPTAGPVIATPLSEERQELDQKLELGVGESKGTENTDNGSDEQRRVVSEELVHGDSERPGKRKRRSRRSNNKRTGPSSETADSESDDELQDN
jgi:hypothetical protein